MKRKAKYHNNKIHIDGEIFDSRKEYNRWVQLKELQDRHVIQGLCRQIKYELIPKQVDENGKMIERPVYYVADFGYVDNRTGKFVVEDTKGYRTRDYIIKRKLMLYMCNLRVVEV